MTSEIKLEMQFSVHDQTFTNGGNLNHNIEMKIRIDRYSPFSEIATILIPLVGSSSI